MIALPPLGTLLTLLVPTAVVSALLWFVPPLAIRPSRWSAGTRATLISVIRGPPVAAVLGAAAVLLDGEISMANPGAIPAPIGPASVAVITELVIVWTIVATVALAVRRHLLSPHERSARFLQYGVYAGGFLGVVLVLLSSPEVPKVAGGIWAIVGFGAGILVTYLTVHILNIILDRYLTALAKHESGLETIYRFLRRVMMLVVILVGVGVSTYANFPSAATALTSLILAAGFLSIVVGLAAQSTLANLIAGAMVSISQPFKIGDAVVFPYPNGDWCIVEDVRLNFTVLRTWDLRRLMVPNSLFQSTVLVNYTAVDPTMLVIVYLVITYDADVDRARAIMAEEARRHPDFLPYGNLPVTHVMDYQGGGGQGSGRYGGVDLRLLSAAKDQSTAFQVEKDLLASIRQRFQSEGIDLAYPTQRILLETAGRRPVPPTRPRAAKG